jgi:hypothetical protein
MIRSSSSRSSFISMKRSTTLIIEGPRKMDSEVSSYPTTDQPQNASDVDLEAARRTSREGEADSQLITMKVGGKPSFFGKDFDEEALGKGILKTVSVEVVEEDIADADRRSAGSLAAIEGADWQTILRAGPSRPPSRAPSRAHSRAQSRGRE